jgi:hypothetical protein
VIRMVSSLEMRAPSSMTQEVKVLGLRHQAGGRSDGCSCSYEDIGDDKDKSNLEQTSSASLSHHIVYGSLRNLVFLSVLGD